jgi:hypothetical protein
MGLATIGLYSLGQDQIKLARDEFNATHRPRITVQRIGHWSIGDDKEMAFVDVPVVNSGEATAIITEFVAEIYVQGADSAFQPTLDPQFASRPDKYLAIGEWTALKTSCPEVWRYDEFKQQYLYPAPHQIVRLYAIGRITYHGEDGLSRQTGFCREYSRITGMWAAVKDSEYEYCY